MTEQSKDKFLYGIATAACQAQSSVIELQFMVEALTKTISESPNVAPIFHGHYKAITASQEAQDLRSGNAELREAAQELGRTLGLI